MKYQCIFILLSLLFIYSAAAQTHETIRTGRPGQSIGGNVVGTGFLQVQSGLDRTSESNDSLDNDAYLFSNVIRLGINEKWEASMVANFQSQEIRNGTSRLVNDGSSSLQIGGRYNIIPKANGLIPTLGIQARVKLTSIDSDYRSKHAIPVLTIASVHKLSDNFNLVTNLGGNFDASKNQPTIFYTTSLGYSINEYWGTFIENYGRVEEKLFYSYVDTGLSYLLTKNHQLDMSVGWGHNHGLQHHFVSLGISSRIKIFN